MEFLSQNYNSPTKTITYHAFLPSPERALDRNIGRSTMIAKKTFFFPSPARALDLNIGCSPMIGENYASPQP